MALHTVREGLLLCAAVLWLACGAEPASGPVEVHWDRDTCEHCSMALGDRRFAAQVRDAEGKAHRFDDLGCALLWLGDASAQEIWVRERSGDGWLDARNARYLTGEQTPMNYGFGAVAEALPGSLGLEEVRAMLRASERERRNPGT